MGAQCETCGNQYDKAFEVVMEGKSRKFDSFECAINSLAPQCTHCGNRIIGHGVEAKRRAATIIHADPRFTGMHALQKRPLTTR